MNSKEMMAQMQIEVELAATLNKLNTLSQYVDPKSEYGQALKALRENLSKDMSHLAAQQ